jgi:hypothetical protein
VSCSKSINRLRQGRERKVYGLRPLSLNIERFFCAFAESIRRHVERGCHADKEDIIGLSLLCCARL